LLSIFTLSATLRTSTTPPPEIPVTSNVLSATTMSEQR